MRKPLSLFLNFLLIFILFGASTTLILLSANIAKQIEHASLLEENDRLIRLYFNQRFRQNGNAISIERLDNQTVLVIDLETHYILIYEDQGQLIEQNSETKEVLKGAGQSLAKLNQLMIEKTDYSWLVSYQNGDQNTVKLSYLRSPS